MRKRVHSSHLALRFYKHNGWTKEILEPYLIRGRVTDQPEGQEPRDYFFLDHTKSSAFDMDRLYAEQVGDVVRWYERDASWAPNETDLEYMRKFNW